MRDFDEEIIDFDPYCQFVYIQHHRAILVVHIIKNHKAEKKMVIVEHQIIMMRIARLKWRQRNLE
jgi:hypothetical protein